LRSHQRLVDGANGKWREEGPLSRHEPLVGYDRSSRVGWAVDRSKAKPSVVLVEEAQAVGQVKVDPIAGKPPFQGADNVSRFIHAECGLRHIGQFFRVCGGEGINVINVGYQQNATGYAPLRSFHFWMARMTDEHHLMTILGLVLPFFVDLGDQGAGGIDDR